MNGFDAKKLALAVNRKLSDEKISVTAARRQIGISRSSFWSIRKANRQPDTNILLPVCQWLNLPFEHFTTNDAGRVTFYETGKTLDKIEALISADPNLPEANKGELFEIFRAEYQIITNLGKQ